MPWSDEDYVGDAAASTLRVLSPLVRKAECRLDEPEDLPDWLVVACGVEERLFALEAASHAGEEWGILVAETEAIATVVDTLPSVLLDPTSRFLLAERLRDSARKEKMNNDESAVPGWAMAP
jgi:hypothetical protein